MILLRSLAPGDRFRVAHPRQLAAGGKPMDRARIFRVTKVYAQTPCYTLSVADEDAKDGPYALGPRTPVLMPKEFDPTEEEVVRFATKRTRKKVVGYRVLWDGKVPLERVALPQAADVMRLIFSFGKTEYSTKELRQLIRENRAWFEGRGPKGDLANILSVYGRRLVEAGLVAEIVDEAPGGGR